MIQFYQNNHIRKIFYDPCNFQKKFVSYRYNPEKLDYRIHHQKQLMKSKKKSTSNQFKTIDLIRSNYPTLRNIQNSSMKMAKISEIQDAFKRQQKKTSKSSKIVKCDAQLFYKQYAPNYKINTEPSQIKYSSINKKNRRIFKGLEIDDNCKFIQSIEEIKQKISRQTKVNYLSSINSNQQTNSQCINSLSIKYPVKKLATINNAVKTFRQPEKKKIHNAFDKLLLLKSKKNQIEDLQISPWQDDKLAN